MINCPICESAIILEIIENDLEFYNCENCQTDFADAAQARNNSLNFNIERMKKALEGPCIILPNGLTNEESIWWIAESIKNPSILPKYLDVGSGFYSDEQEREITRFVKEKYKEFNNDQ